MFAKRRMKRIFRPDGRSLIVAMDHVGFMDKPIKSLMKANDTIRECVVNGADAIMTTSRTLMSCVDEVADAGMILTVPQADRPAIDGAVGQALRMGADAVKILVYPFRAYPEPTMLNQVWLGQMCDEWGMPLLSEPIPGGWTAGEEMRTPETIAAGARVSAEAGADFVKTLPTAKAEDFQLVADNCPVPVVVLGGAKAESDRDLLQSVKDMVDNGAAGVAMGRNVFEHASPGAIVAALSAIIHEDASVDEALKEMGTVAA